MDASYFMWAHFFGRSGDGGRPTTTRCAFQIVGRTVKLRMDLTHSVTV